MRFLGIDIGTTFLKGAVLDLDAGSFGHVHRAPAPDPLPGLPPTRHELDPGDLLDAVHALLAELLQAAPDAAGLVVCGQMHGLVVCDDRGNARTAAITWKDQRALEPAAGGNGTVFDELVRLVTEEARQAIGNELRVGVPITTLHWLRSRGGPIGHLYPASLLDYVVAELCDTEPTTDPTNAAAHGLFDLAAGDWHWGLIEKLGLGDLRWPRIVPSGSRVGEAEIDGRRLACFAPVGDQQCALAGVGLWERELSLNISTGSQASLLAARPTPGEFQVRPYFDGRWLRTIVGVPAGRSLAVLMDLLTELGQPPGDPWEAIADAVEAIPETDLEVDLSFFASQTGSRGSVRNISEANLTAGHLFAAAFRNMAGQYARCAALLSPGREWGRVAFSGGLARRFRRLRREVLAALGDPPHRLCPSEEDTLRGLLALALVCAGRAKTVAEATELCPVSE